LIVATTTTITSNVRVVVVAASGDSHEQHLPRLRWWDRSTSRTLIWELPGMFFFSSFEWDSKVELPQRFL